MKQRDAHYEFIRTSAMVLVVLAHALANTTASTAADKACYDVLVTIAFLCNGLFFMLSGRFALAAPCSNWEECRRFYLKRLVGLGVPILVYMLIRTVYDAGWTFPVRTIARNYTLNVLGHYEEIEFWFLYQLSGMLLIAPVIGKFFQQAGARELKLVLALGLGYLTLRLYMPELGLPFDWGYYLSADLFAFLLGGCLEKLVSTQRQKRTMYLLGAASFVLTLIQKRIGFAPGVHSSAPTYIFMICAAFLGLKNLYRSGPLADRVFNWIGRYSISVYMIHVIVLNGLKKVIPVNAYVPRVLALTLLTVAVSLAVGFVIDNTVVKPVQKLLYRKWKI